MRIDSVHQPLHLVSEIHRCAPLSHLQMSPTSQRLKEHEQVPRSVALVLIVIALTVPGHSPYRQAGLLNQLLRGLVKADHRAMGVIWAFINIQYIFHASYKFSAYLGNAPLDFLPGFELVFFSILRTVSGEMDSAKPSWITLEASSRNVQ